MATRKRSHKARKHFVADFETTTKVDDCRVWLWAMVELGSHSPAHGIDMQSFIEHIGKMDAVIHFHNLKFDGTFLLDWLLNQGFKYNDKADKAMTFEVLIDKMAKFYSIKVMWRNGYVTEFRDSLKKLPYRVAEIAKAFDLPIAKGDIDYKAERPVGYQPTADEVEYAYLDVLIVAAALESQMAEGMTRLTAGSDSLAEYKHVMGGQKKFEKLFPVLTHAIDGDIRLALRGGFTFASPLFKSREVGCGSVYDVNSLYPSIMYSEPLPYGEPEWFDGYPDESKSHPLFIVSMTFTATIKPDHIPLIQVKGASMFSDTEYQTVIDEPTTLSFTNIDLDMVFKHYDVNVLSYNGGWQFKAGKGMFTEFIDKWSAIKATSTGALRAIAKLHLNSLFGKFGSNPDITGKYPILKDGVVKLVLGEEGVRSPVYTAMSVFITSYGRALTVTAAQANYDRFAYCDTDSLHLMGTTPPVGVEVDASKLGLWDWEGDFDKAFYIRAKGYIERMVTCAHFREDGKTRQSFLRCGICKIKCEKMSVHIAGVPLNIADGMDFDDIFDNHKLEGKLVPRNVPGGVVLEDGFFTLKL